MQYAKKTDFLSDNIDVKKTLWYFIFDKNRNYLNERIEIWNQNTIYPQAIIVIDLNNIKLTRKGLDLANQVFEEFI